MNHSSNHHDTLPSIEDTIAGLSRKGVRLWLENGALRYRARKGAVTSEDIASIQRSEAKLCSLLSSSRLVAQLEPRLIKRPHATRAPLAFSQLVYWNLRGSTRRRPIRQVASVTRVLGPLDVGALREAVSEVVRRHEALRTRVVLLDGVPVQELVGQNSCSLELQHLGHISYVDQTSQIGRCIDSVILDAVDYAVDPLFRSAILRMANDHNILIIAMDHVISDGVSLNVVQDEILAIYSNVMSGRDVSLPPIDMHCIDYAVWQNELSVRLEDQAVRRSDLRLTKFPSEAEVSNQRGWGSIRFCVGRSAKAALQVWARRRGTSVTMVALSLYAALVLRWCETFEVVVQVMTDGRVGRALECTVACIAFPLYVRIVADGRESFEELFETVTREYCRAYEQPDFYYSYVQNPAADFTRNTVFNWLPQRRRSDGERILVRDESVSCTPVQFENPLLERFKCNAEPMVVFEDGEDHISGEVHFAKDRFSESLMQRFVSNFGLLVNAFVESPSTRVWGVDIFGAGADQARR